MSSAALIIPSDDRYRVGFFADMQVIGDDG